MSVLPNPTEYLELALTLIRAFCDWKWQQKNSLGPRFATRFNFNQWAAGVYDRNSFYSETCSSNLTIWRFFQSIPVDLRARFSGPSFSSYSVLACTLSRHYRGSLMLCFIRRRSVRRRTCSVTSIPTSKCRTRIARSWNGLFGKS